VVINLIADAPAFLNPGGRFYLVAKTKQGAKSFAKEMSRYFTRVDQVGQGSGYRVFRGELG
jgi:16S rRNA G1207 methylase RsmC